MCGLGHCPTSSIYSNSNSNRIQRRKSRFLTIFSPRRELSLTRTLKWPWRNRVQITCNTSSTYHVQHLVLRATWYKGTAQLLSLTELKSHLFQLYLLPEPLTDEEGGNRSARRKPLTTSFRKCHIPQPENSSPNRDSNPHSSIGGRLGKQTCQSLHHASEYCTNHTPIG